MSFKSSFENLKKNKWVWIIYIPLAIGINFVISLYPSCLFQIAVGLMTFAIPYYFGVRSVKDFLKVGLIIIVVTGLIFGMVYTYFLYNQMYVFEPNPLDNHDLEGGTVTPYLGDRDDPINYSVRYTGAVDPENITVYVNIMDFDGGFEKSIPLIESNGTYYNVTFVEENIYYYNFSAFINTSETWLRTENGFGPITLPFSRAVGVQMFIGVGYLLFNGGIFFFIILAFYYWRKNSVEQQMKMRKEIEMEARIKEKALEEQDDEYDDADEEEVKAVDSEDFECNECGASVPADAVTCPSCGEAFDDEEAEKESKAVVSEEFECTECGASVPEDAQNCPSCGEPFDDD